MQQQLEFFFEGGGLSAPWPDNLAWEFTVKFSSVAVLNLMFW
jgi:hypothetical protein